MTAVVCPFCAVGCSMQWLPPLREGLPARFRGTPGHPVNDGLLCARGVSAAYEATGHDRLLQPLWRAPRTKDWEALSWDEALGKATEALAQARTASWNPDTRSARGLVFWGGATAMNEEVYLFARLARALGVVDLDHQARLCHSATTTALGASLGLPAATHPWHDLAKASWILVLGANPAQAHPIADRWLAQARRDGARILVVDPRPSPTLRHGDVHLAVRPGTDVALLLALVRAVLERDALDTTWLQQATDAGWHVPQEAEFRDGRFGGWEAESGRYDTKQWAYTSQTRDLAHPQSVLQALRRHVAPYHEEAVEALCGLAPGQLKEICSLVAGSAGPGAVVYSMGLVQQSSGVAAVRAVVLLQALLGNLTRAGGGIYPLKGHANIQGATDLGGTFEFLPGYLPSPTVAEPTLVAYEARHGETAAGRLRCLLHAWFGHPEAYERLPLHPGGSACSLLGSLERMGRGEVEALVVLGQNPVRGTSNPRQTRRALGRLPFLLCLDPFLTETAEFWREDPGCETGVLALPTTSFLEKPGTRTSITRRIEHQQARLSPKGEARPDAQVLTSLMEGLREHPLTRDALSGLLWPGSSASPSEALYAQVLGEMAGQDAQQQPLAHTGELALDGSTPVGCWLYAGAARGIAAQGAWVWPDNQERLPLPERGLRLWASPHEFEPGLCDGPFPAYYEAPGSWHPHPWHPQQPYHPSFDQLLEPVDGEAWPLLLCVRISDQEVGRCGRRERRGDLQAEPLVLEVSEATAQSLGLEAGQRARLTTPRAVAEGLVRIIKAPAGSAGGGAGGIGTGLELGGAGGRVAPGQNLVWAPASWSRYADSTDPDLVLADPGDASSMVLQVRGVPCRLEALA